MSKRKWWWQNVMSRQGGKGDEEGLLYFFRIVGGTPVEREPKKFERAELLVVKDVH
jgi:hypothetical protein